MTANRDERPPRSAGVTTQTQVRRQIRAPRSAVYRAILDAEAVATWMVPTGMRSEVHLFEPRTGGRFRISLTYDEPTAAGKTTAHTDTYHGEFVELVPDERVVETMEFETEDPSMRGEMTVTFRLTAAGDGTTEIVGIHENVPPGVSAADNELGWSMALDKLADYVEGR